MFSCICRATARMVGLLLLVVSQTALLQGQQPAQEPEKSKTPSRWGRIKDKVKQDVKEAWKKGQQPQPQGGETPNISVPQRGPETAPSGSVSTPAKPPATSITGTPSELEGLIRYTDIPPNALSVCPPGLPPLPKPEDLQNCSSSPDRCSLAVVALMAHNRLGDVKHLFDPKQADFSNTAIRFQNDWNGFTAGGFVGMRYGGPYVESKNGLFWVNVVWRQDGFINRIDFHNIHQGNESLDTPQDPLTAKAAQFIQAWKQRDQVAMAAMMNSEALARYSSFNGHSFQSGAIERCFLARVGAANNNRSRVATTTCLGTHRAFTLALFFPLQADVIEAVSIYPHREASSLGMCSAPLVQTPCDTAISQLNNIRDPADDPTAGFVRNQKCIAVASCSSAAVKDNEWLNKVVEDFVSPFTSEKGRWKEIQASCRALAGPAAFKSMICQQRMAQYHIEEDLQMALNKNGCGSQEDWDAIGTMLKSCVSQGVSEDLGEVPLRAQEFASSMVVMMRDSVRQKCIQYRTKKGLPLQ